MVQLQLVWLIVASVGQTTASRGSPWSRSRNPVRGDSASLSERGDSWYRRATAFDYVGCVSDGSKRALTGYSVDSGSMTIEKCQAMCDSKGFIYAGLESECPRTCYLRFADSSQMEDSAMFVGCDPPVGVPLTLFASAEMLSQTAKAKRSLVASTPVPATRPRNAEDHISYPVSSQLWRQASIPLIIGKFTKSRPQHPHLLRNQPPLQAPEQRPLRPHHLLRGRLLRPELRPLHRQRPPPPREQPRLRVFNPPPVLNPLLLRYTQTQPVRLVPME